MPEHPGLADILEEHRLDSLSIGKHPNDHHLANLPDDLGSKAVSIDIGWIAEGEGATEKDVMVDVLAAHVYVLTESGRVLYASDGNAQNPKDLPPSVHISFSAGGFALGADGIWRG